MGEELKTTGEVGGETVPMIESEKWYKSRRDAAVVLAVGLLATVLYPWADKINDLLLGYVLDNTPLLMYMLLYPVHDTPMLYYASAAALVAMGLRIRYFWRWFLAGAYVLPAVRAIYISIRYQPQIDIWTLLYILYHGSVVLIYGAPLAYVIYWLRRYMERRREENGG